MNIEVVELIVYIFMTFTVFLANWNIDKKRYGSAWYWGFVSLWMLLLVTK